MDNGRGENEFMEMMGLKEKMFPGEKMCPWEWIVVTEERWGQGDVVWGNDIPRGEGGSRKKFFPEDRWWARRRWGQGKVVIGGDNIP